MNRRFCLSILTADILSQCTPILLQYKYLMNAKNLVSTSIVVDVLVGKTPSTDQAVLLPSK
jgi:hypothetical protein